MPGRSYLRDLNPSAFWMGITVFFWYAFAGISLHLAVAAQLRLSADETASWILIVWVTSAAASIYASLLYRIPIPITWTIPGIIDPALWPDVLATPRSWGPTSSLVS